MRSSNFFSRIIISLFIGFMAASLAIYPGASLTGEGGDLFWALRAARDLFAGSDPYRYPYNILSVPYPLPAAFIGMFFAWLPDLYAGAGFFGLSTALLAFTLTRRNEYWRLLVFVSYPFIEAALCVQWAPLMMTAAMIPDLLPLTIIKPQIGLAAAVYKRPSLRGILFMVLVLIVSLVIYPAWPIVWLSQLGPYAGYIPVLLPGGLILLLSALRLYSHEGRFLLALSLLPKRSLYDHTMLWLIPQTWQEMLLLTVISWVGLLMLGPEGQVYIFSLYFTTLVYVLRPLIMPIIYKYSQIEGLSG